MSGSVDAESQDAFTRTDPTPLARSAGASTDREVRSSGEIRVKYGDKYDGRNVHAHAVDEQY